MWCLHMHARCLQTTCVFICILYNFILCVFICIAGATLPPHHTYTHKDKHTHVGKQNGVHLIYALEVATVMHSLIHCGGASVHYCAGPEAHQCGDPEPQLPSTMEAIHTTTVTQLRFILPYCGTNLIFLGSVNTEILHSLHFQIRFQSISFAALELTRT